MMKQSEEFTVVTRRVKSTRRIGQMIGESLRTGVVIGLTGDLGAGKTSFVQGLAAGLGIAETTDVVSPTYTLANVHEGGRLQLVHMDLYRLESPQAIHALGLEQYFTTSALCVSVIEWADRFTELMPKDAVWIVFECSTKGERRITVRGMAKPPGMRFLGPKSSTCP